ncbi:MAG: hypothetical protein H6512_02930 [Acidimicrobiia bacterium]|nr:hypothetical protein [Acidimicrobiia bacterium]
MATATSSERSPGRARPSTWTRRHTLSTRIWLPALTTLQDSSTRGAYAKTDVAEPVAERIAELAVNNFLVAGLEARSHGLHDVEAVSTDELDFGPDVGQAFRRYLERTQQSCTVLALDGQPIDMIELLTVLALTEAPGIPVELWTVLNDALDHRPVDAKGSSRLSSRLAPASFWTAPMQSTDESFDYSIRPSMTPS